MVSILTTPARPINGQHGTTDTALLVRFPEGDVIPVGVQVGRTADEYVSAYHMPGDGYTVLGVRQDGRTDWF